LPPRLTASLFAAALTLFAQAPAYQEPYRPQFHFSPARNWTNDPNGLVYFEGEYHLFFQFNPFGDRWGHMSWGHAVSRDLVRWRELPVALPEANGIMIFTGSTVVDEHNSSGFCTAAKPCLVAIYTGHTQAAASRPALQTQNLAYSNDRGRTWTKYAQNPVLDLHMPDFRDPKVLWSDRAKRWVMAVSLPNDHKVRFYGSADLKHWQALSDFGPAGATSGQWECPELFELPVESKSGQTRWVLKVGLNPGALQGGSGEQYFVGQFDGTHFTNDNPPGLTLWTDYGKDCYCALTFNNLPRTQSPVMIGWMNNWQYAADVPTSPWRGQMTVPRKLGLRSTPQGLRLVQNPIDALEQLRRPWNPESDTFELRSTVQLGNAKEVGWRLIAAGGAFTLVGFDREKQEIFIDRTHSGNTSFSKDFPVRTSAPLRLNGGQLRLRVLVDRSSVEVFAGDGLVAMTNLVFPSPGKRRIEFHSQGGPAGGVKTDFWTLGSIW
jgi:sucrose-6-phosphate hydrolase SacC (GH32 family)